MAIWEEIKDGSTTFRRPTVKADGTRNQTASELRDIGIRALLGKLPGNLPIMADIGLHLMGPNTDAALEKGKKYLSLLREPASAHGLTFRFLSRFLKFLLVP